MSIPVDIDQFVLKDLNITNKGGGIYMGDKMSIRINIKFNSFIFVPREIYNITTITRLNIVAIKMCAISHNIINLQNLSNLTLQYTFTEHISKNILELKSLTRIYISFPYCDGDAPLYIGPPGNKFDQYYHQVLAPYLSTQTIKRKNI